LAGTSSFTADQTVSESSPQWILIESGVTADNARWDVMADAEQFRIRTRNDANNAGANAITIDRTGTTVDTINLAATAVQANSNTIWHAGNDGAASTLDADLLDGQSGSFYQSASNLNAGTIPDARIQSSGVTQHMDDGYGRNITGKAGVTKTLSTSTPSGGSDGDIWYRY
jgi:hypothetical protein